MARRDRPAGAGRERRPPRCGRRWPGPGRCGCPRHRRARRPAAPRAGRRARPRCGTDPATVTRLRRAAGRGVPSADSGFDLAFIPTSFIPQPAVHSGLPRVAAALHPGGWLIMGHGKLGDTPVQDALTRLRTLAYGGTPLDKAAACRLLRNAGLTSVRSVTTSAAYHRPETSMTATAMTPKPWALGSWHWAPAGPRHWLLRREGRRTSRFGSGRRGGRQLSAGCGYDWLMVSAP